MPARRVSQLERLPSMFISEPNSGCWLWLGSVDKQGYGKFHVLGLGSLAHRVVFQVERGPIGSGLTLDHLCRNPPCVNPAHLEAVPGIVNTLRGTSFSAVYARRTHCQEGHPFDTANTYTRQERRRCRACQREAVRRYKARKRGAP